MRDIKFRGKRLENGEWVYGSLVSIHDTAIIVEDCDFSWDPDTDITAFWFDKKENEVDPATVGQYTEQKDKNGKDIWEGDIVEWENLMKTNMRSVIAYQDRMFCFVDANNEPEEIWCYSFTKIGNIHDNPELLK